MQFLPGLFVREHSVDGGAVVVGAAVPGMDFAAQCSEVPDSALSRTLSAEQAYFDSGLVKAAPFLSMTLPYLSLWSCKKFRA